MYQPVRQEDPFAGVNVPLVTPPAQTNPAADTTLTFAGLVGHVRIQNKTAANLYWEIDGAATLGSAMIAPGQTEYIDWSCQALHLYTVAATNINGSADANIVVKARV